jgi:putative membrane protein
MIGDWLQAWYPWIKTGHVVSIIAWMAALFYLPRLFVYHTERAAEGPALVDAQGRHDVRDPARTGR